MNPILVTITCVAAWLIAVFFALAFVHGAQILRRQEVAALAAAPQDADQETAPATHFTPGSTGLPAAA
ncbi:hypothetical protein [Paenarthrobacter sp. C1]|uniref:hypothetical protein n=1 Tax=Paenarthrobacter sp. C1 TaxID=3400220 RepID=UPI003BF4F0E3